MKKIALLPVFFVLLPVFFVFHGFVENIGFISIADCLPLLGLYLLIAGFFFLVFFLLLRNSNAAALITFFLLCCYFFFGAMHDFMKAHCHHLARYSLMLPFFAASAIALFFYLRKRKVPGSLVLFLNCLFLVYLVVDAGTLITKTNRGRVNPAVPTGLLTRFYKPTDSVAKPDIYLLIFDEYCANRTLRSVFNYDNSGLDSFLIHQGFYEPKQCRSNYYFTLYSMASMLNLDYLREFPSGTRVKPDDVAVPVERIRTNEVVNFLMARGYTIINNSPLDVPEHPGGIQQPFIPLKSKLITRRTMLNYISRDIGPWLEQILKDSITLEDDNITSVSRVNSALFDSTLAVSARPSATPRFVYMHVFMPHWPFLFDSLQHRRTLSDITSRPTLTDDPERYLGYLPYVNARIRELVTSIQQHSRGQAVILLMSDHGYRYSYDPNKYEQPYFYNNQNAVYLPGRDYSGFYDSITNVNQFRVLFSKLFQLNLPLLKDSVIFLQSSGADKNY